MKRWNAGWQHQLCFRGLLSRQKGDLFTFHLTDGTPKSQVSLSQLEQPWLENSEAVKLDSSWEDTQEAQVTFLAAINSQLLLQFQNRGCSDAEWPFPSGSTQSGAGGLCVSQLWADGSWLLETNTVRSPVLFLSLAGHYPCFLIIALLVLAARSLPSFSALHIMDLNYFCPHRLAYLPVSLTFIMCSTHEKGIWCSHLSNKKKSLRLCKTYYFALQKKNVIVPWGSIYPVSVTISWCLNDTVNIRGLPG